MWSACHQVSRRVVSTTWTTHPKMGHQLVGWLGSFGSSFDRNLFVDVSSRFVASIRPHIGPDLV